jgi:GT2 family glycosyltransferase
MSTAAVIVTYNGRPWIEQCLRSLVTQGDQVKIWVVDNASTDGTLRFVREQFPMVELVQLPRNLGFGAANNIGIARSLDAGATRVLLLNQDAWLPEGSLDALVQFMAAHPTFGVCSPLHCSPEESQVDPKTLGNYLIRYGREYLADLIAGTPKNFYQVHGVNAAIWLVDSETWLKVGGFDPLFFMYGEDDDWLRRLEFHGLRFALVPKIRAVHLRQSPASPPARRWGEAVVRAASWEYSRLLLLVKSPRASRSHVLSLLVVRGLLEPVLDFAVDHSPKRLAARWLALARVVRRLRDIWRSNALIAQAGPTFISSK